MSVTHLEVTQITVSKFHYPFILRYINNFQFSLFLFVLPIWQYFRKYKNLSTNIIRINNTSSLKQNGANIDYNPFLWFTIYSICASTAQSGAGIMVNISSEGLTVPTMNAIAGIKPVFVLILSVFVLNEKLTLWTIIAMIVALMGIMLFVLEIKENESAHKSGATHDTYWGILLTIGWNIGFGIHDIFSKKVYLACYENDKIFVGSISYVVYQSICGLVIYLWTLFYPSMFNARQLTWVQIQWITAEGCVIFVLQSLICIGIAIKSPFYITIGSLLAIPVSFVVDMFVHGYIPNVYAIVGAVCLLSSFLMLEILKPDEKKKRFVWCLFCNRALVNGKYHDEDYGDMLSVNQTSLLDSTSGGGDVLDGREMHENVSSVHYVLDGSSG